MVVVVGAVVTGSAGGTVLGPYPKKSIITWYK